MKHTAALVQYNRSF